MVFDVAAVRARFGALDGSFAFFDAPGGTQVPDEVGAAIAATMRTASGNTGAVYPASKAVEAVAEEARQLAARFAGSSPDEIIFGANMTTLNFTLSRTAGRAWLPGDEILVTRLDHDANVAPWLDLAQDKDLVVRQVDVLPDSSLDIADLRRKLTDQTRVVAFPWAANSLGTVTDARLVAELAHQSGAIAWADAVQYAPHFPIDLPATGVDVVLFSAYKFCGPHLGIGYGRRELLESWIPYKARPAPVSPVGARFQTGSLPIETLGGFSATMRYLDSIGGLPAIAEWERELSERFLAGLPEGTVLYGMPGTEGRVPIFLLNLPGVPAAEVPVRLAEQGIGVWSGTNYYSLGLYERLDWGEAVRVGIAHYNTLDEIDRLTAALAAMCGQQPVVRTSGPARPLADGVTVADLLGDPDGSHGLHQRRLTLAGGASLSGSAAGHGEAWYVLDGDGVLSAGGADAALRPGTAIWLRAACAYRCATDSGLEILAVTVRAGAEPGDAGPVLRAVTLDECAAERTGDREFRVLLSEGLTITAFAGRIPPGRAPEHQHTYDEVVHVLAGRGVVHLAAADAEIGPGTSIYLPPGQPHCLENTGAETLEVLGVFHPAGSPAAKRET